MRAQVMSDLHFDFHRDGGDSFLGSLHPSNVDVLVLAGDICEMAQKELARSVFSVICRKYERVLWVPGNHEYYSDSSIERTEDTMQEIEAENKELTLLRAGTVVEVKGQRFLGDTLWFTDDPLMAVMKRRIKDSKHIRELYPWAHERNTVLRKFLQRELRKGDIVVTHHLPSRASIAPRWQNAVNNHFFVSPQDDLIHEREPSFWLHGHTHDPQEYILGQTHVIANPLGYPYEAVPFDYAKIIER